MQVYVKATNLQRLAAFLIDWLLISFIAGLLTNLIIKITPYDSERYNELYDLIKEVYKNHPTDIINEVGKSNLIEFFKLYMIQQIINSGCMLVLFIGYLVILPYFWEKQTLGRLISNTKVIRHKGDIKCNMSNLVLREIVGTFLMYVIFGTIGVIITLVLILTSRRSLVDYIGKTDFVMFNPVMVDENGNATFVNNNNNNSNDNTVYNNNPKYDDSIDAKVDEPKKESTINNDTSDNNDNSDEEDDYIVI